MPYLQGPKVDPADVMADGQKFQDIDEFKQLLLKDKDQLARNLTERLVTYATGAAPQPGDQKEIEAIVGSIRDKITACGRWCMRSCKTGCSCLSEAFEVRYVIARETLTSPPCCSLIGKK